jgi:hypothetical protein
MNFKPLKIRRTHICYILKILEFTIEGIHFTSCNP